MLHYSLHYAIYSIIANLRNKNKSFFCYYLITVYKQIKQWSSQKLHISHNRLFVFSLHITEFQIHSGGMISITPPPEIRLKNGFSLNSAEAQSRYSFLFEIFCHFRHQTIHSIPRTGKQATHACETYCDLLVTLSFPLKGTIRATKGEHSIGGVIESIWFRLKVWTLVNYLC